MPPTDSRVYYVKKIIIKVNKKKKEKWAVCQHHAFVLLTGEKNRIIKKLAKSSILQIGICSQIVFTRRSLSEIQ